MFQSSYEQYDRKFPGGFQGPKRPRSSSVIPHCKLGMAAICDISRVSLGRYTSRNSERAVSTSSTPLADKSAQKRLCQLL